MDDIAHLKLCVKHNSTEADGKSFLNRILDVTKEHVGVNGPVVTCFGVDLLYPGLDLEIDAMAFKSNHQRMTLGPAGSKVHDGYFSDSIRASGEIWVSGQVEQRGDGARGL